MGLPHPPELDALHRTLTGDRDPSPEILTRLRLNDAITSCLKMIPDPGLDADRLKCILICFLPKFPTYILVRAQVWLYFAKQESAGSFTFSLPISPISSVHSTTYSRPTSRPQS